mgnify:CR=1 FL=1
MGTYSVNGSIVETVLMLLAGLVGFFMKLFGFSPAALVLALVLGALLKSHPGATAYDVSVPGQPTVR